VPSTRADPAARALDLAHLPRVVARRVDPQCHFGCAAHGVSAAKVTARRSTRPVLHEPWGRPACGPRSSRAERGRAARPRPTRARAGCRRSKPPPQFGHTFDRTASTQSRQTCTRTSRSSRRSRWARVGGCTSRTWVGAQACSHYRARVHRPAAGHGNLPIRLPIYCSGWATTGWTPQTRHPT
jgi:hypothetical protein